MNKWIGMGRPTKSPEIKNGVARFTFAVDRKYKKEGMPTADFISCVAFGKTAEFIEKYVKQGRRYTVEGHIQTGNYTNKDGQKVYTTDVVLEGIEFADSKNDASGSDGGNNKSEKKSEDFVNVPEGVEDEGLPFN